MAFADLPFADLPFADLPFPERPFPFSDWPSAPANDRPLVAPANDRPLIAPANDPAGNAALQRYAAQAGEQATIGNGHQPGGYLTASSPPPWPGPTELPSVGSGWARVPEPADERGTVAPVPVKILVAGGFGVGKTTAVGAISEIAPLTTEAEMTSAGIGIDDPGKRTSKTTTTVAMDFGSVTIDSSLKLYLFGTPGQSRFGFMWDDLARGALGALVVVDSSRLDDCYPAVDFFERAGIPFVVAANAFDGRLAHDLDSIRWALAIDEQIPVLRFDARDRLSVRDALLVLLDRALARAIQQRPD